MTSLKDKIVFVTGGANGIGKAIVSTFCLAGADVTFCDIDRKGGEHLCEELYLYKPSFIQVDVSDKEQLWSALTRIVSEKGNIDIVINNVGISEFGSILNVSIDDFDKVLAINLRSVFITSKFLAQHRSQHEQFNTYGRIVNIASTRYLMSEANSEAYAASKGGIVSLTHALAVSLSEFNITVNCISPGWIEAGDYSRLTVTDHKQHPSGRVGIPADIAEACLFLCHPNNNFINGQNIIIDGGMTKKMIYEE